MTWGVGLDMRTGRYYVVRDGQKLARTFSSSEAAVGFIDATQEWEAVEMARERALESELARAREREAEA